jgi:putative membrane protein
LSFRRRQESVSDCGSEPDPRFSFANERTFLAWTRTALALMLAGGAVAQFADSAGDLVRGTLTVALMGLGSLVAYVGYSRWRQAEIALRLDESLPRARAPLYIGLGLTIGGAAIAAVVAVSLLR